MSDENGERKGKRGGGCLRWILVLFTGGFSGFGVAAVAIVIATIFGVQIATDIFADLQDAILPPQQAQVSSSRTILLGIQPLGQLVNVSAQVAKADIRVEVTAGILNACGFSANHVAEGTVEAGIDLTLLTENDIDYDRSSDTYTLNVPAPQLTSCRVDFIRQYERSFVTCPADFDEARVLAQHQAVNEFREDAIAGGVLERAREESALFLSSFVTTLTGSNAAINFSTNFTPAVPLSCQPDPPTGWEYDPIQLEWNKR